MNAELDWYNTSKIDKYNCAWNLISGARRIGKTVNLTTKMINEFLNKGGQSVWVRDYQVQFNQQFCSRMLQDTKRLGICPEEWVAIPQVGVFTSDDKRTAELVCYFQSLNTSSNSRGGGTPDTNLILFDEFMPEKGRYPSNPLTSLQSIVTTYTNARTDAKVYCASNFISSSNPYFVGMKVYPDVKKDITVYEEDSIALEICRGYRTAKVPDSGIAKGLKRGGYAEYSSPTEDVMFDLIKTTKKGKRYQALIYSEDEFYQIKEVDNLVYISPYKGNIPSNQYIFTSDRDTITTRIEYRPKWFYDRMKNAFEGKRLRFDSPNTMFAITKMFFSF